MSIVPGANWYAIRDGDRRMRAMLNAHYSGIHYRDNRRVVLSIGPGYKMCLMTVDGLAVFAWRKFIDASGQTGVNNCIFQNNGPLLSSDLILEAEQLAWLRWPGERLYTYVDPSKVSANPGYCYKKAGWQLVRDVDGKPFLTGSGKIVLEKYPITLAATRATNERMNE